MLKNLNHCVHYHKKNLNLVLVYWHASSLQVCVNSLVTIIGFNRSIASSAPIWQFTGMTPCNAFYRVTSSVYTKTSAECGLTILASWKAIDNVTATGIVFYLNYCMPSVAFSIRFWNLKFRPINITVIYF